MAHRSPKTYTKKDVAQRVAELQGERLSLALSWTNAVFQALRETMMLADPELRIEVREFGVFEVKVTKSKPKARNPRTGEVFFVPKHRKSHFKPGKMLKQFFSQALDEQSERV